MIKNDSKGEFLLKNSFVKIILIMKFIILFMVFATIAATAETFSQYAKISINVKDGTIEDVFKEIEAQTDFNVFYKVDQVNVEKKITVNAENELLSELLDRILPEIGASYTVLDKIIVIKSASDNTSQQEVKITGVVKAKDTNGPLPGASVVIKGTSNGTITDLNGKFEITVPQADVSLVISYVGYVSQTLALEGHTNIDVTLEPESRALDEVVVIGYGTVKKSDLTGSVGVINAKDIKTEGSNNALKAIQGKVAGVTIESSGGWPGARNRVLIRGISTINNGRTDPLYVLDGIPVNNIDNLLPSDIESFSILKDASAAAIYGARASNGVVIVTTKSGKKGENRVDFKANYGWQKLAKKIDVCNSEEWAKIDNAAHDNDNINRLDLADNLSVDAQGNIINTDWQNEIFQVAPMQDYEISTSGGGDYFNYSFSGGYNGQKGIVKLTNYDKLNLRLKSEYKKGRLRVGESMILSNEKWRSMPDGWGGQGGNPVGSALLMIPIYKVHSDTAAGGFDGAYGSVVNVANPLAQLYLQEPNDEWSNVTLNLFAELEILKGLKYKYNIGYIKAFRYETLYTYKYNVGTFFTSPFYGLYENREQSNDFLQEHTLNYDKTIGKLNLQALAGFTFQKTQWKGLNGSASDLPEGLRVMDAAVDPQLIHGSEYDWAYVSYLGRIMASYDNKYLFTASIRRDGSSRFGKGNTFGNFPSFALGWDVSKENFFSSLAVIVSNLKPRFSYGVLGNQNIGDYQYSTTIFMNDNYVIGTDQHKWVGAIQEQFAAKNIKWESATTTNGGIDLGLLQNKITFTGDYFIKKNYDILLQKPIPISAGASNNPWQNVGKLTNKGIEFSLNYKNNAGEFYYDLTGTFTHVTSIVTDMGINPQPIYSGPSTHHGDNTTITQVGDEIGSFYLIKTAGIFNDTNEINAYTGVDSAGNSMFDKNGNPVLIQPKAVPGDIKFVDANHDGKITADDRQICGSASPKFEYSFNADLRWKGFDFTIFLQGVYGNKIYNGIRQDLEDTRTQWNYSKDVLNFWTPENTNTNIPRPTTLDKNGNNNNSDRYLEDGSYLRIKTMQLGYTLPKALLGKIKIDNIRIYGSVDNLFTLTKYKGFNPDLGRNDRTWRADLLSIGVDLAHVSYPLPRIWVIGAQVSL